MRLYFVSLLGLAFWDIKFDSEYVTKTIGYFSSLSHHFVNSFFPFPLSLTTCCPSCLPVYFYLIFQFLLQGNIFMLHSVYSVNVNNNINYVQANHGGKILCMDFDNHSYDEMCVLLLIMRWDQNKDLLGDEWKLEV